MHVCPKCGYEEPDLIGMDLAARLSPKYKKIVALIYSGLSNGAIATRLNSTEQTIKNDVSLIFCRLACANRGEVSRLVHEHYKLAEIVDAALSST